VGQEEKTGEDQEEGEVRRGRKRESGPRAELAKVNAEQEEDEVEEKAISFIATSGATPFSSTRSRSYPRYDQRCLCSSNALS
jgi:hypothetical protein